MDELSKILPENEAVIYTEVGNEKLNYLAAYSIIATKNGGVKSIDLQSLAESMANAMRGNTCYSLDNGLVISDSQAFKIAQETDFQDMKSNVLEYANDMDITDDDYALIEKNIDEITQAACEAYTDASLMSESDCIFDTIKNKLSEIKSEQNKNKSNDDLMK